MLDNGGCCGEISINVMYLYYHSDNNANMGNSFVVNLKLLMIII